MASVDVVLASGTALRALLRFLLRALSVLRLHRPASVSHLRPRWASTRLGRFASAPGQHQQTSSYAPDEERAINPVR